MDRHATNRRLVARRAVRAVTILLVATLVVPTSGCAQLFPPPPPGSGPGGSLSSVPTSPTPPPSIPPTLAPVVAPPSSGAYLGVYQPPAPFVMSALATYAKLSSKPPAIVMWYQPWATDGPHEFDAAAAVSVYEQGAIPMVTWEPWDPGKNANYVKSPQNQPKFRLSNIVAGKYDLYIRRFARSVKSVRGPVMIRLMHEMNGNWYPWDGTVNGNSPAMFVKAWRHIHDQFKREGVTNVTWVWSINHESVPAGSANRYAAYWPGSAYVDWVAMSGFNWGTSSPYSSWHTFDFWYHTPLAYLKRLHKPIVIAEFASVEQGGSKSAWITDAYMRIRKQHPEVDAVIYYDNKEVGPGSTQDWRIATSASSLRAYRSAVGNSYFVAAPASTLASWTAGLTEANWNYLRALPPIY